MEMLESFALNFYNLDIIEHSLIIVGIVIFGFVLALVEWSESTLSLRRMPYFFLSAIVIALMSLSSIANLFVFDLMKSGFLWILVLFVFIVNFVAGFACGVLSHARSVDAYGHGGRAWLALIPLVGLILLFKRPLDWQPSSASQVAFNVGGVIAGFVILVAGGLVDRYVGHRLEVAAVETRDDPVLESLRLKAAVDEQGLEATLVQIANEIPSQRIDEAMELIRVEGDRTTLRYFYVVALDMPTLPNSMRTDLIRNTCTLEFMQPLIAAGATIEHVYLNRERNDIGTVRITSRICGS